MTLYKAVKCIRNFFSPTETRKLSNLRMLAEFQFKDYRLTWPQMNWWYDQSFNAYLQQFGEKNGFNTHRKWMLWQLIRLVENVPGDTAECGVYKGASSWLICAAIRNHKQFKRVHHLFDSYEGLSEPSSIDGQHWSAGDLSFAEKQVLNTLGAFKRLIISHKGWIPERFDDVKNSFFSFVHVDVDLYQPTKDSIEFFYDRISPGGLFLCDDYGFTTCPGVTRAVDEYLSDKPEKMISLDAGGGFFIKGVNTGNAIIYSNGDKNE